MQMEWQSVWTLIRLLLWSRSTLFARTDLEVSAWPSGWCSWFQIMGSHVWIPLEARVFLKLSWHRAFHIHPSIISKWLKYCWQGCKTLTRPSIHQTWLSETRNVTIWSVFHIHVQCNLRRKALIWKFSFFDLMFYTAVKCTDICLLCFYMFFCLFY